MILDIGAGVSVLVAHIEAIEYVDDYTSRVHTMSHTFESPMPKSVLVSLIEQRSDVKDKSSRIEDLLLKIYSTSSTPRP